MDYYLEKIISNSRSPQMGIAMIMVILYHLVCGNFFSEIPCGNLFLWYGHWGVDIFLFLSGFGIYYSLQKPGQTICKFYERRLWRLMPACLIAGWIAVVFFDPYLINSLNISRLIGLQEWYIRCLILFYLVAPLVLYCIKRYNWRGWMPAVVISMCVFSCVFAYAFERNLFSINKSVLATFRGTIQFALCRFPAFAFGIYVAASSSYSKMMNNWRYPALAVVCLVSAFVGHFYVFSGYWGYSDYVRVISYVCLGGAIPMISYMMAVGMKRLPAWIVAALTWVGTYSLEIFLMHCLVFRYVKERAISVCGGGYNGYVYLVIAMLMVLIVAYALNKTVLVIVKHIHQR